MELCGIFSHIAALAKNATYRKSVVANNPNTISSSILSPPNSIGSPGQEVMQRRCQTTQQCECLSAVDLKTFIKQSVSNWMDATGDQAGHVIELHQHHQIQHPKRGKIKFWVEQTSDFLRMDLKWLNILIDYGPIAVCSASCRN
jgi:hypothetical protein